MNQEKPSALLTRRSFVRSSALAVATIVSGRPHSTGAAVPSDISATGKRSDFLVASALLTPADQFRDVSRGDPKIFSLKGDDLVRARLTPETWRLEITPDATPSPNANETAAVSKALRLAEGNALDLAALKELGTTGGVRFLKAMQCLNIPSPLGQGLWEGVPLREVLRLCGAMKNVRRLYYWGYHNNDPKQLFQSSMSYSQAMETPPGGLPAFLAYRLNGEPLSLLRGGPVRMIVPWAHGFKSIKWLQSIVLTNDYKANDTYAEANNDPESHLKTAAYAADMPKSFRDREPVLFRGLVISGLSGLQRVEYCLTGGPAAASAGTGKDTDIWNPCRLEEPPRDWRKVLPAGVSTRRILGFDAKTGKPSSWPLPYSMISWSAALNRLPPGKYSIRARAVDQNGFAQPEPRPNQKSGMNALEVREFEVMGA